MPISRLFASLALPTLGLAACQGGVQVDGALPADTQSRQGTRLTQDLRLELQGGEDTLTVDRAKVLVGEMEIEGRSESSEFETGAQVIELGLDGSSADIAFADVPAGKYQEFGFELAGGGSVSAEGSDAFGERESIIVEGDFNGAPFRYASDYVAELEWDLNDFRVRDGEVATLKVEFDVASWFAAADGILLDPNDPANREAIESKIRESVAAHAEDEDDDDDEKNDGEDLD